MRASLQGETKRKPGPAAAAYRMLALQTQKQKRERERELHARSYRSHPALALDLVVRKLHPHTRPHHTHPHTLTTHTPTHPPSRPPSHRPAPQPAKQFSTFERWGWVDGRHLVWGQVPAGIICTSLPHKDTANCASSRSEAMVYRFGHCVLAIFNFTVYVLRVLRVISRREVYLHTPRPGVFRRASCCGQETELMGPSCSATHTCCPSQSKATSHHADTGGLFIYSLPWIEGGRELPIGWLK